MKHFISFWVLSLFSANVLSATMVELKVDGDLAIFKTATAKTHVEPSCVGESLKPYWGVDLTTASGKAMYSSLVAAFSLGAHVEAQTSGACSSEKGYELAKSVALSSVSSGIKVARLAGFAGPYEGNFGAQTVDGYDNPLAAMDGVCAARFGGARTMQWQDYLEIKHVYKPHKGKQVWMFNPISHISQSAYANNGYKSIRTSDI